MSIQTPEQLDKLIEERIEPNPQRPGAADVRLKEYGVPVWALIGHLEVVNGDITQVARDYAILGEAVNAAPRDSTSTAMRDPTVASISAPLPAP